MKKCANCGKLFLARKKKRTKNYKFCCSDCYWEYRVLKNGGKK